LEGHPVAQERIGGSRPRILFVYWGRRGLSELVLRLAETVKAAPIGHAAFSISRQNDRFHDFLHLGDAIEAVDTFRSGAGAILCAWRMRGLTEQILTRIQRDRIDTVVLLMPHVWGHLLAPLVRRVGARLVTIVHDAIPHPGDLRSLIASWRTGGHHDSDLIIALSAHVEKQLKATGSSAAHRVRRLFLPELRLASPTSPTFPASGQPFRLLFLGRILPYKGLDMLIDAAELLRREGVPLQLGVFGEGDLGRNRVRLTAIGADVTNRWLSAEEMGAVLARYHAVVLSHTEASQSGVASLALGHGLPVVSTPVGGLKEQIEDGVTGVLAERVDALALASAIKLVAQNPFLYATLVAGVQRSHDSRSVRAFLAGLACHISELPGDRPVEEKPAPQQYGARALATSGATVAR
jgi:glycosyltransferase involved in cell wall biosynthesis